MAVMSGRYIFNWVGLVLPAQAAEEPMIIGTRVLHINTNKLSIWKHSKVCKQPVEPLRSTGCHKGTSTSDQKEHLSNVLPLIMFLYNREGYIHKSKQKIIQPQPVNNLFNRKQLRIHPVTTAQTLPAPDWTMLHLVFLDLKLDRHSYSLGHSLIVFLKTFEVRNNPHSCWICLHFRSTTII